MPRFAVLEHTWNGIHWDFLLERGEVLRTWAIDAEIIANAELPARSLPDHRRIYLDYEGPISGDRGNVRRIASGTYHLIEWTDNRVVVSLIGDQLNGELALSRVRGDDWSFFLSGKVD
jgi:hypothetical protein